MHKYPKLEDSDFFKEQILEVLPRQLDILPFEENLPFDPSIINVFAQAQYVEAIPKEQILISSNKLINEDQYFIEEKKNLFLEKVRKDFSFAQQEIEFLRMICKVREGLFAYKDFINEWDFHIDEPFVGEIAKINCKGKKYIIALVEQTKERKEEMYVFEEKQSQQKIVKFSIGEAINSIYYTRVQIDQFYPQVKYSCELSYNQNSFFLQIQLTSPEFNPLTKVKKLCKILTYFHEKLKISFPSNKIHPQLPIFTDFKDVRNSNPSLYAYEIVNFFHFCMDQMKIYKFQQEMEKIMELGSESDLIKRWKTFREKALQKE